MTEEQTMNLLQLEMSRVKDKVNKIDGLIQNMEQDNTQLANNIIEF